MFSRLTKEKNDAVRIANKHQKSGNRKGGKGNGNGNAPSGIVNGPGCWKCCNAKGASPKKPSGPPKNGKTI